MAITASLSVSPSAPAAGAVVTAAYSVSGAAGTSHTIAFSGTVTVDGTSYPESTGSLTVPGAPAEAVTYAVPACPGLSFTAAATPGTFTATVPASGTGGTVTVTGSATVGGSVVSATASLTLPGSGPVQPSGTVPYPGALAAGHTLLNEYLPGDLYAWRYMPGTTTPVTNGSGVSENPNSPRNVSVATDGGVGVLRLGVTSAADCGVIQSPAQYPTDSGVIETLIKFSGNGSGHFADWASFWAYGAGWPAGGEIDAVETQYGQSYVSYHYGTNGQDTEATDDPWTYSTKKVQLQPEVTGSVPAPPNILPDTWTHVTLAFGKDGAGNHEVDVYYEGVRYCTISGPYVTGAPMWITAGTGFGGPVLGSSQAPYDVAGDIEIQYIRVFS